MTDAAASGSPSLGTGNDAGYVVTYPVAPPTPLPVEPLSVNENPDVTVIVHVPLAAVLMRCAVMLTEFPVES
jgi:hypothetical protein